MSIDRYKGYIIFECDRCHETLETGTREFNEALNELNNEGWRAQKVFPDTRGDGVWRHYCKGCK